MSLCNWDSIILEYNLSKNKDVKFLYESSDKILPRLTEIDLSKYQVIQHGQSHKLPTDLNRTLDRRIRLFKDKIENDTWLSWNYADYKAYLYFEETEN